ncbi:unnamed protein product [Thlaspi arvense]|uniref:Plant thionin family protein n=1 Tax=Thlaspi arvense TaxID=13288 RepID=A0AAU9RIG4_THLAR|nr:unnamed protein product [Thlaspi arvense]
MDNKSRVAVMMFVLVVMAATGGEAINHFCSFQCSMTCHDIEFTTPCYKQCMIACDHRPLATFHSTSHSQMMKTRETNKMR